MSGFVNSPISMDSKINFGADTISRTHVKFTRDRHFNTAVHIVCGYFNNTHYTFYLYGKNWKILTAAILLSRRSVILHSAVPRLNLLYIITVF